MNNYERIARIIRFLDAHAMEDPGLAELAAEAGLSPSHLHRMFSVWAGITPKDFVQCLRADYAGRMLRAGSRVLDTALDVGLSGPGRLHDLCVCIDAASPGEIKSGGVGMQIHIGVADSPFGDCVLAECDRGICHLAFPAPGAVDAEIAEFRNAWPAAECIRDDALAAHLAERIFRLPDPSASGLPPLRAWVRGTPFQVRVWRALLEIPAGRLMSYGRLASAIGQPTASRAVGSAVGSNAISWLIPCHRVIRETGIAGNYRWDPERKRIMLAWEHARQVTRGTQTSPDDVRRRVRSE